MGAIELIPIGRIKIEPALKKGEAMENVKLPTSLILSTSKAPSETNKILLLLLAMPRTWATPEQANWLHGHIPDFLKAQADKSLPRFYALLYQAWFDKWSERDRLFGTDSEEEELT